MDFLILAADVGSVPDPGMYELLEKILWGVSFMAIGGTVAVLFFLIFAQTINGSRTTHSQLQAVLRQMDKMNGHLQEIAERLKQNASGTDDKPKA